MLSQEQVDAYLERIGCERPQKLDREALDGIIYAHQCSIPFETLSIHRSEQAPSTDADDLYDKVIVRKLGGYCFELNKLLEELLVSLGFDARPVLCRAVRGRDGRMPINHRGVLVDIDGESFLADAGFGGPMAAGAFSIDAEGDQIIRGEIFAAIPADDSWVKMERMTRAKFDTYDDDRDERRQIELEICKAPVEDIDFAALNAYFAAPGTPFHDHEVANLRMDNGYLGFKDGVLTVRDNGEKTVYEFESQEDADAALREHFGLVFD